MQLEDQSFLIGGLEVQKYSDFVKVWTILRYYGGNECVYIAEPGPYQGQVFWNDHESGLFAMECIDEFVEEEGLDGEEPNAILEAIPSFDEERSLDDVLNEIRWNRPDSAIALIDGLSPPIWRKAKRSPAKAKSSVAKSKKKRASTKK